MEGWVCGVGIRICGVGMKIVGGMCRAWKEDPSDRVRIWEEELGSRKIGCGLEDGIITVIANCEDG